MQYRQLGTTGLKVSEICLGTMIFGTDIDEQMSAAVLNAALDEGINFLDTSNFYGRGRSEGKPSSPKGIVCFLKTKLY